MRAIAAIVLVESRDDGIRISSNVLVDGGFLALEPITDESLIVRFLRALMGTDIEIGIAESGAVETGLHPVMVHAESTENDFSVVATDIIVERFDFSCSQIEEDRIDELHDVVVLELRHPSQHIEKVTNRVPFPR